jgi:hypothetical protein
MCLRKPLNKGCNSRAFGEEVQRVDMGAALLLLGGIGVGILQGAKRVNPLGRDIPVTFNSSGRNPALEPLCASSGIRRGLGWLGIEHRDPVQHGFDGHTPKALIVAGDEENAGPTEDGPNVV